MLHTIVYYGIREMSTPSQIVLASIEQLMCVICNLVQYMQIQMQKSFDIKEIRLNQYMVVLCVFNRYQKTFY